MKASKRGSPMNNASSMGEHFWRSKSLSQNFLRDSRLIESLVLHSGITKADTVLDIGAGTGSITRELAKHCRSVIAIEKDPELAERLAQTIRGLTNAELIRGDILQVELPAYPYKVFANIPYSLTAAIITMSTSSTRPPLTTHLVVQTEAAHKYMGMPRESMCALFLKPWFRVSIAHYFNRQDFSPVPSVDSVLLRIDKRQTPLLSPTVQSLYRDFIVYCFVHAGHSLCATLERLVGPNAMGAVTSTLHISRSATPTAVDFEIWLCLFSEFVQHGSRSARQLIAGSELRLKEEQSRLPKEYHTQRHRRW
jgi:16S rRNA A1518/A1519 N6-dimethyltransferase RsmA/KsgA/DIM1 with predicted DNA glycosylase/AP lyase activity